MKETAETHLGEKVKGAVVKVPAYFMILGVRPPRTGTIAELNMMCIIDELTAAAIAYGLDKSAVSWSATWEEVFSTCPCEPSKMHF